MMTGLINTYCTNGQVKYLPLGEVGTFIRCSGLTKADFTESGVGCIHYGQIYTYYGVHADKTKTFTSASLAKKLKKAQKGDLIIAVISENDKDLCKAVAWLGDDEIVIGQGAYIYRHRLNPKYVAYYFMTEQFHKQKRPYITGTKVEQIYSTDLSKIKIPVPPLHVQEEIVEKLDAFMTLIDDMSGALPAELEARTKQYEYYRAKLLSFD